jgi:hypothetical protein
MSDINQAHKHCTPIGSIALALQLCLGAAIACKSPPPEPEKQYTHEAQTNALILQDGSTTTGPVRYISKSTGKEYTASLGQHIELETTTKETELYTVVINADGALEREIKEVPITNTTIDTNVARLAGLNIDNLLKYVLFDNKNKSWTPTTIHVISNPDTDGTRLPQSYLNEVIRALNDVKTWSKKYGTQEYITSVTLDTNGTNNYDEYRTVAPPEGMIYVYKVHDTTGVTNVSYPYPRGRKVSSAKIWVNTTSAAPINCYQETFDSLVQDNQNTWTAGIEQWFCLMLNRPRDTNSYEIHSTYETQAGLDTYTTAKSTSQSQTLRIPDPTGTGFFTNFTSEPIYRTVEVATPKKANETTKAVQKRKKE